MYVYIYIQTFLLLSWLLLTSDSNITIQNILCSDSATKYMPERPLSDSLMICATIMKIELELRIQQYHIQTDTHTVTPWAPVGAKSLLLYISMREFRGMTQ